MIKKILFTLICLCTCFSFSQKVEKESRIDEDKVPLISLNYLKNSSVSDKIKWYFEENELGNSYEAKFKLKRQKISIEFDIEGKFQDVEIEISKSKIPRKIQRRMFKYFGVYFTKHKVQKIQKQFKGDSYIILDQIRNLSIFDATPTFFEVIVEGKNEDNELKAIEFLFDTSGNLISSKNVVQYNTDNLAY